MWLLSVLATYPREEYLMDVCCKGNAVGSLRQVAERLGSKVLHCPLTALHVPFIYRLTRIIKDGSYDIVHNHLEAYSALVVFAAKLAGVPVITAFHNTSFAPQSILRLPVLRHLRSAYVELSVRLAISHSDIVTACSRGVFEIFRLGELSLGRGRILWYGVDLIPRLSPDDRRLFRQSFGWSEASKVIVHVGRFEEQKNHRGLLQIFALIRKVVPEAKLLLVGDGALRASIVSAARCSDQFDQDDVVFAGMRDDVPFLLGCSDLFVFPSLFEGFGLAALEAQSAGLPVVASKVNGLSDAVESGNGGELIQVDDLEGFAGFAVKLFQDPKLWEEVSVAARKRVESKFSKLQSSKALFQLYEECSRRD